MKFCCIFVVCFLFETNRIPWHFLTTEISRLKNDNEIDRLKNQIKQLEIIGMFAQTSWLVKYLLGFITNIYTFLFMFDNML